MLRGTIPDRLFPMLFASIVNERVKKLTNLKKERGVIQRHARRSFRDGFLEKANEIKDHPDSRRIDAEINLLCIPGFDDQSSRRRPPEIILAKLAWDIGQ